MRDAILDTFVARFESVPDAGPRVVGDTARMAVLRAWHRAVALAPMRSLRR
jgi:hypothetical protein